ncbi:unnamed protein product [Owenia fusiformis]|uniref:Uncharacterized protein n=1 Tax=Owenia fusiformis TaxID=6347 RepID=A0A8J1XKY4_OWEFU|nr:unnamed protein product [Owenia fusiformis]
MASLDTGIGPSLAGADRQLNAQNRSSLTKEQHLQLELDRTRNELKSIRARLETLEYQNGTTRIRCESEIDLRVAYENKIQVRDMNLKDLKEENNNYVEKNYELETTISELKVMLNESRGEISEIKKRMIDISGKLQFEVDKNSGLERQVESYEENAHKLLMETKKNENNLEKVKELYEKAVCSRDQYVVNFERTVKENKELRSTIYNLDSELMKCKNDLGLSREEIETLYNESAAFTRILVENNRVIDIQSAESVLKRREQSLERRIHQWNQREAQEKQLIPLYHGQIRELKRTNAKLRTEKEESYRQKEEGLKREKHLGRKLEKAHDKYNRQRIGERDEQRLETMGRKFGRRVTPRVRKYSGRYTAERKKVWKSLVCIIVLAVVYTIYNYWC